MFDQSYPEENPAALVLEETEYAVQINSKIILRAKFKNGLTDEELQYCALAKDEIKERIGDKPVRKCIVVKGRLINLIV